MLTFFYSLFISEHFDTRFESVLTLVTEIWPFGIGRSSFLVSKNNAVSVLLPFFVSISGYTIRIVTDIFRLNSASILFDKEDETRKGSNMPKTQNHKILTF